MPDGLRMQVGAFNDWLSRRTQGMELQLRATVGEALFEHMLTVMDRAKELCPKESGALAESGRVNRVEIRATSITCTLDFGVEPFLDYALDQHENLLYAHKDGESAKFLELALLEWLAEDGPEEVIADVELLLGRSI